MSLNIFSKAGGITLRLGTADHSLNTPCTVVSQINKKKIRLTLSAVAISQKTSTHLFGNRVADDQNSIITCMTKGYKSNDPRSKKKCK